MTDKQNGEMPEVTETTNANSGDMPEWVNDPQKAWDTIRKLREENATRRLKLQEFESEAEKRARELLAQEEATLQENQQWRELAEKRARELEELQQSMQAMELDNLRRSIGLELGLPSALVDRIRGANEEEMRADAEAIKSAIPTQQQQPSAGRSTTTANPGGKPIGRTREELASRYLGGGARPGGSSNSAGGRTADGKWKFGG